MRTNWTRESMAVTRFVMGRQGATDAMPPCEMTEHEERVHDDLLDLLTESVAEVSGRYLDPNCRYLRHPAHVCHDRDGNPLQRFQSCWLEARLQVLQQGATVHAAEVAAGVRS